MIQGYMALNVEPMYVYPNHIRSQSGLSCVVQNKNKLHLLRTKWECFGVKAVFHAEEERPMRPMSLRLSDLGSSSTYERIDESHIIKFKGFHTYLKPLPKTLSAKDHVAPGHDGTKVRVAYQGSPGAYTETAALKAYPVCKTVPCDQNETVFKAVELWLADKGVLPIENSVDGSIHRNYDLLLRHRLHIVGEVELLVNHCLLGLPGVRKEELTHVLSHPQALEQCETTLYNLGIVRVNTHDAAGAAQIVALEGKRETGAVASLQAAEIYRLDVLAQTIQDDADNITRFLILAREPLIPKTDKPHKTSIVFSLEEGPEVLFKALAIFALRDINLIKIESRPQRKHPLRTVDNRNKGRTMYFDYLFYVDFEASMADPRSQYALSHLKKFATFLRVLGCYPVNMAL